MERTYRTVTPLNEGDADALNPPTLPPPFRQPMNALQKQLVLSDGRTLQEQALAGVTLCADIPAMVAAIKRDAAHAGTPLPRTPVSIEEFERDMATIRS